MSTKAGTIGVAGRPARFTLWTMLVSMASAAALVMSALALSVAIREDRSAVSAADSAADAASVGVPLWDAYKLDAMRGRALAERVRSEGPAPLWDAHKLDAMRGRALAERARADAYAPLWDAGKLDAMRGRALAG